MSKQSDDLIDRITGTCRALTGLKVTLTPIPAQYPTEAGMPLIPAKEVSQDDYAFAKKLAAELKDLAENLEAEISRESKVPEHDSGRGKSQASTKV